HGLCPTLASALTSFTSPPRSCARKGTPSCGKPSALQRLSLTQPHEPTALKRSPRTCCPLWWKTACGQPPTPRQGGARAMRAFGKHNRRLWPSYWANPPQPILLKILKKRHIRSLCLTGQIL